MSIIKLTKALILKKIKSNLKFLFRLLSVRKSEHQLIAIVKGLIVFLTFWDSRDF